MTQDEIDELNRNFDKYWFVPVEKQKLDLQPKEIAFEAYKAGYTEIIKQLSETNDNLAEKLARAILAIYLMKEGLERLQDIKMWKTSSIGGQDSHAGKPPAIRVIDGLLEIPISPEHLDQYIAKATSNLTKPQPTSQEVMDAATIAQLQAGIKELEKAICIYCREEVGHIDFQTDKSAIEYILSFTEEYPLGETK